MRENPEREPFSIIWTEPPVASHFLSSYPRFVQELSHSSCYSASVRRELVGFRQVIVRELPGACDTAFAC